MGDDRSQITRGGSKHRQIDRSIAFIPVFSQLYVYSALPLFAVRDHSVDRSIARSIGWFLGCVQHNTTYKKNGYMASVSLHIRAASGNIRQKWLDSLPQVTELMYLPKRCGFFELEPVATEYFTNRSADKISRRDTVGSSWVQLSSRCYFRCQDEIPRI